ncbi:MAG TPA: lysylphosphatidylglycerol synthase transmembrane domain-containing protein, partial [Fibrobacteraceae bacterium]|nr:lysylphosphatidylglycerol synthase transmembrane domain-containing protein [Fibrobacteraceae bacterium]
MKKSLLWVLKLLVTVIPGWIVFRDIQAMPGLESVRFAGLMAHMGWQWLLIAALALAASSFLGAAQWGLLLVTQGVKMSYIEVLRIYFMGLFFNNFMPGNVGGDLKRIADIRMESGHKLGAGAAATIFDRLFGLFFLNALAIIVGFLFFVKDPGKAPYLLPSLAVFCGFCALFAAMFSRRIGRLFERALRPWAPKLVVENFVSLRDRFHLFRNQKLWLQVTVLSAVTQIFRVSVHWLCGLAIGVDIAVSWYFYFIPIVAVITALPISIGGFGVREASAVYLFKQVGVTSM